MEPSRLGIADSQVRTRRIVSVCELYARLRISELQQSFGATGSFTYNANKWLGLTAEIGGYHFKRQIYGPPDSSGVSSLESLVRKFAELLVRTADQSPALRPLRAFRRSAVWRGALRFAAYRHRNSQSSFALAAGGGVDAVIFKNLAWRVFEADYFMTNFTGHLGGCQWASEQFPHRHRSGSALGLSTGTAEAESSAGGFLLGDADLGLPGLDGSRCHSRGGDGCGQRSSDLHLHSDRWHGGRNRPGCALEPLRIGYRFLHRQCQGRRRPRRHSDLRRRRCGQQASEPAASDLLRAGTQPDHRRRTRRQSIRPRATRTAIH